MIKRKPVAIKEILQQAVTGIEKQRKNTVFKEEIESFWKEAAGEKAAKHSSPTQLKGETLTINVDSPIWIYQLNINKQKIEKSLARLLHKKNITIKLRTGEN